MFINRPSDRVRDAARDHIDGQVAIVIPVSWGLGLSTPGVFAFVLLLVLGGTLIGPLVSNLALAAIMFLPIAAILIQTRRGAMGQGMVAATAPTSASMQDDESAETPTDDGRSAVVLKARRFSISTPSGDAHRSYPAGTEIRLLENRRWWQGVKCKVGDDIYFVNPNFDDEVHLVLDRVST